jgi:fluoride ion exporter CrcB/FEX
VHLVHTGHRAEAVVYTLGSLIVCLAAASAGIGLAGLL